MSQDGVNLSKFLGFLFAALSGFAAAPAAAGGAGEIQTAAPGRPAEAHPAATRTAAEAGGRE